MSERADVIAGFRRLQHLCATVHERNDPQRLLVHCAVVAEGDGNLFTHLVAHIARETVAWDVEAPHGRLGPAGEAVRIEDVDKPRGLFYAKDFIGWIIMRLQPAPPGGHLACTRCGALVQASKEEGPCVRADLEMPHHDEAKPWAEVHFGAAS